MTQETYEKCDGAVAYFHLPGLFEFYGLYSLFLPLFYNHREYFYDWCEIGSIYGAPADCLWGGGRVGFGDDEAEKVLQLTQKYGISARLTFSNSLIKQEHLSDRKCNRLCEMFSESKAVPNGVIICSDLLLEYIGNNYPGLYFVSSTTKVLTDFIQLEKELSREDFRFVVPDFRLNKAFDKLGTLTKSRKARWNFCATNAVISAVPTGKAVMKMSAVKVCVRIARILYAVLPAATRGTSFQRLWKTLRLSERTILKTPICRWGSISSR